MATLYAELSNVKATNEISMPPAAKSTKITNKLHQLLNSTTNISENTGNDQRHQQQFDISLNPTATTTSTTTKKSSPQPPATSNCSIANETKSIAAQQQLINGLITPLNGSVNSELISTTSIKSLKDQRALKLAFELSMVNLSSTATDNLSLSSLSTTRQPQTTSSNSTLSQFQQNYNLTSNLSPGTESQAANVGLFNDCDLSLSVLAAAAAATTNGSGGTNRLNTFLLPSLEEQRCNSNITASKKSQNMTECVPVPSSEHVAEIVGRQGCKIKALRAKTNTYIKTPVRGEEPVFVVTGRKEDVCKAKREILSAAEHFSLIRASRKPSGVQSQLESTTFNAISATSPNSSIPLQNVKFSNQTSSLPFPIQPGQMTILVRVPYRVVGLVVGPKGATIKNIQQQTRTYIVTPSRDKEPVFEVTGQPENVRKAQNQIEAHIALRTAVAAAAVGGNPEHFQQSGFQPDFYSPDSGNSSNSSTFSNPIEIFGSLRTGTILNDLLMNPEYSSSNCTEKLEYINFNYENQENFGTGLKNLNFENQNFQAAAKGNSENFSNVPNKSIDNANFQYLETNFGTSANFNEDTFENHVTENLTENHLLQKISGNKFLKFAGTNLEEFNVNNEFNETISGIHGNFNIDEKCSQDNLDGNSIFKKNSPTELLEILNHQQTKQICQNPQLASQLNHNVLHNQQNSQKIQQNVKQSNEPTIKSDQFLRNLQKLNKSNENVIDNFIGNYLNGEFIGEPCGELDNNYEGNNRRNIIGENFKFQYENDEYIQNIGESLRIANSENLIGKKYVYEKSNEKPISIAETEEKNSSGQIFVGGSNFQNQNSENFQKVNFQQIPLKIENQQPFPQSSNSSSSSISSISSLTYLTKSSKTEALQQIQQQQQQQRSKNFSNNSVISPIQMELISLWKTQQQQNKIDPTISLGTTIASYAKLDVTNSDATNLETVNSNSVNKVNSTDIDEGIGESPTINIWQLHQPQLQQQTTKQQQQHYILSSPSISPTDSLLNSTNVNKKYFP